jgi:capsular exopolysaccharide synthesis family protein
VRWWRSGEREPPRFGGVLVSVAAPASCGSEVFRALRTKLLAGGTDRPIRRLLVTSPAAKDGKTTVAANLAAVYAQQGFRTLLVDCDLRRPRQHQLFRVPLQPGLSTLVAGECRPDDAIRATGLEGLSVVPAGAAPRNPVELLATEAMRATLSRLAEDCDVLVLDTPPVLAAADALVLSGYTDGVLLVTRAGRTERVEAQAALQQLHDVHAHVIGAVLNDPDAVVPRSGGRYYYYGYQAEA